jgi:predicted GIY-YIG superfamily endonuclease
MNLFRGSPPKDGIYVYGLTDDNGVFYIGTTGFMLFRYSQHTTEHLCHKHIYDMRIKGQFPGIVIYGIFEGLHQAEAAEHCLIRSYVLIRA